MSPNAPSIGQLAHAGLSGMVRAARAMPGLSIGLLCVVAVAAYIGDAVPRGFGGAGAAGFVVSLAVDAVATAAVAVTMHRFLLLGETNTVFSLAARRRVLLDFATVLFGAQFLILLPMVLAGSIWETQEATPAWAAAGCIGVALLGFAILLRHVLVFPAIAAEAQDRSLRASAAGAGRIVPRVVLACLLAMITISLIAFAVALPLILIGLKDAVVGSPLFRATAQLAASAATVAVVSRAYLWREGRLPDGGA